MKGSAFYRVIDTLLKHEGGYVDHPADPGGATKYGITRRTLAAHRRYASYKNLPKSEVMNLTLSEAKTIYKRNYWDAIRLDELPGGIAYALFDYGVNSGQSRAIKAVQKLLGLKRTGRMDDATVTAINKQNESLLVMKVCKYRMQFLQRLKHWRTFGKGWTRRVKGVEQLALQLAASLPEPDAAVRQQQAQAQTQSPAPTPSPRPTVARKQRIYPVAEQPVKRSAPSQPSGDVLSAEDLELLRK